MSKRPIDLVDALYAAADAAKIAQETGNDADIKEAVEAKGRCAEIEIFGCE